MTTYRCIKCKTQFQYAGCYAKLKCPRCYSRNVMTEAGYKKIKKNGYLSQIKTDDN